MGKLAVAALLVAPLLSVAVLGHGVVTGIAVPDPDPTPGQAAYERYHRGISGPLFLAACVGWLIAGAAGMLWIGRRAVGSGSHR